METITLTAVVGEDRRLVIDLPKDTPTGPVELVIRSASSNPAREAARAKLLAAGALATNFGISDELQPISDEEIRRLGIMAPGARPSEELINEDRGDY
jgi:hypothetical protein